MHSFLQIDFQNDLNLKYFENEEDFGTLSDIYSVSININERV